ncbi:histamine H1 receptor [Gadus morhua]|uniref:Histamine H1 receptor n=1 Tax=Gadus morhua TaxID=8049 RepID=A0A8C5AQJ7_GADMO|nr:histamine H1 receptor [Gadus morhua]XP_030231540.1 histamine H1 receptor [Gadus morhua]
MMEPGFAASLDRLHLNSGIFDAVHNWSVLHNDTRSNETLSLQDFVYSTALGVFLGLVSLLTVLMNLLVLYAVRREKSLHTVGNLYIASLSVADLIVGATVMPLNLVYLLRDEWLLGRAVCQFWLIMDYVASTASIFNLFILCLDRYRSVRQPLKYLKYRTRGRACLMISGAWLLSMMWIVPILGWRWFTPVDLKPEDENKCDTDFRFVTWFKVITAIFNFYVPSILMLWFYTHIYLAVRQHLRERERIVHPTDSFGDNEIEHSALNPEVSACKSPVRNKDPLGRYTKNDHLMDHNTLDQRYSLEEMAILKSQKESAQRSMLMMTTEQISRKNNRSSPELLLQKQTNTTTIPSLPGGSACIACLDEHNDIKHYVSINECRVTVPNSVSGEFDLGHLSKVKQYTTVMYNKDVSQSTHSVEETSQETASNQANGVTMKQTWQRFVDQSRLRIQSLRIRKEHKAAKQLGFIIAAFLLCWIPYFIAFMVMAFCQRCVHHDLHMFTIWLGYINSTLNPFIYPLCNGNFKKVFKSILHIPEHL